MSSRCIRCSETFIRKYLLQALGPPGSYRAETPVFLRYIFLEPEPSLKIPNRREARENVLRLRRFVKLSLEEAKGGVSFFQRVFQI